MKITRTSTIKQVNEVFNSLFPFLRLSFHTSRHSDHEGSPAGTELNEEKFLQDLGVDHDEEMALDGALSVSAFEEQLENKFGLHVQVLRRSGNLWLQTTSTDDWTLESQNIRGKASVK